MRNEHGLRFERQLGAWSGKSKQVTRAEMKLKSGDSPNWLPHQSRQTLPPRSGLTPE